MGLRLVVHDAGRNVDNLNNFLHFIHRIQGRYLDLNILVFFWTIRLVAQNEDLLGELLLAQLEQVLDAVL